LEVRVVSFRYDFLTFLVNFFDLITFTQISNDRTPSDVNPTPKAERLLAEKDEAPCENDDFSKAENISKHGAFSFKSFFAVGAVFPSFLVFDLTNQTAVPENPGAKPSPNEMHCFKRNKKHQ